MWSGLLLAEQEDAEVRRARLEHPARLRVAATGRVYSVAANLFEAVGRETVLHDHRFPLAVFPFALDADLEAPLYAMQWLDERQGGVASVRTVLPGATWAVSAPSKVRHTVRSLRPHASIVIADVTDAPTREQRLAAERLPPKEVTRVRTLVLDAFVRALRGDLPDGGEGSRERGGLRTPTVPD